MSLTTPVAVQKCDPFGQLVLLGSPDNYMLHGQGNCLVLLSDDVIHLHDEARQHKAQQTRKLLQTLGMERWWWHPEYLPVSPLEGAIVRKSLHLRSRRPKCPSAVHGFCSVEDIAELAHGPAGCAEAMSVECLFAWNFSVTSSVVLSLPYENFTCQKQCTALHHHVAQAKTPYL